MDNFGLMVPYWNYGFCGVFLKKSFILYTLHCHDIVDKFVQTECNSTYQSISEDLQIKWSQYRSRLEIIQVFSQQRKNTLEASSLKESLRILQQYLEQILTKDLQKELEDASGLLDLHFLYSDRTREVRIEPLKQFLQALFSAQHLTNLLHDVSKNSPINHQAYYRYATGLVFNFQRVYKVLVEILGIKMQQNAYVEEFIALLDEMAQGFHITGSLSPSQKFEKETEYLIKQFKKYFALPSEVVYQELQEALVTMNENLQNITVDFENVDSNYQWIKKLIPVAMEWMEVEHLETKKCLQTEIEYLLEYNTSASSYISEQRNSYSRP